ncbi:hypothetical protein CRG98_010549, partial [Punica granatum]
MAEMEPETTLGGSLLVPSVQELAEQPLTSVPERYIRTDQEPPSMASDCHKEIPVIDMQRLLISGDSVESSAELHKLHSACKDWGFFQLINHGASSSVVEKAKHEIKELFRLPKEEKKELWQEPGDISGFGQAFVVSDEQKLDWGDLFYMVTLPPHLRKPQLYSKLPQSF